MRRIALAVVLALAAAPTAADERNVYRERRARLMERIGPDSMAVLQAAARIPDGGRQNANFFYLTGLEEEGAVLVLAPGERRHREFLFLKPRDPEEERWTGDREPLGSALRQRTGFEMVLRTSRLGKTLADLSTRVKSLAYLGPVVPFQAPVPPELDLYRKLAERAPGLQIRNRQEILREMRAVKDAGEIARIRRAVAITLEGHFEAWRAVRPGMKEYELKARIESAFRRAGARRLAYPSIVGSGPHGTVLHAQRDDRPIGENELIVIDCGAEWEGYASDVTRTIPSTGKFTPEQRRIYEIVLAAQKAALAEVKPGAFISENVHAAARNVISAAGFGDAFLHGTSHFVGLRVHDDGDDTKPLKPGMVLTVEPGIYLPEKGIGVRIEDTVVVTDGGHENLSAGLPREPDDIEKWMAQARGEGR
jgi:Xaa-Pro aminopeptidase